MKKAQAALEFLTTYGWAILILIIAVASLVGLGVFSPKVGTMCESLEPIFCTDVKLDSDGMFSITLSSSGTSTKIGEETKLEGIDLEMPIKTSSTTINQIINNENTEINYPFSGFNSKGRFSGKAKIIYTDPESSLSHKVKISFSGNIE